METEIIWKKFDSLLNSEISPNEKFRELYTFISQHSEQELPIENLQVDIEIENIEMIQWLQEIFTSVKIPNEIKAIWIGILQYLDEDNIEKYGSYFGGSVQFDSNDIDWASDLNYLPEDRYFSIECINTIMSSLDNECDDYFIWDWIIPIAITSFIYQEIFKKLGEIHNTSFRYTDYNIACGYDSGDWTMLFRK